MGLLPIACTLKMDVVVIHNPSTIKTMMTNSTTPPPTHPEMMKTMMMNTAEAAAAQPAVVQIVNGIKDVASQVATTCAGGGLCCPA